MAKLSDRQKLINKINARLRSYKLTPNDLKAVQENVSSVNGVYPTKSGISIDKITWTMDSENIINSLEDKITTLKDRMKEARNEIVVTRGKEAATPEAIHAKMVGNLYTESIFDEAYSEYYDVMPNKESINPAKLKEDPLKSKLYDDMKEFGSLVRHRNNDSKTLELKASIISQVAAIKERDKNAKKD